MKNQQREFVFKSKFFTVFRFDLTKESTKKINFMTYGNIGSLIRIFIPKKYEKVAPKRNYTRRVAKNFLIINIKSSNLPINDFISLLCEKTYSICLTKTINKLNRDEFSISIRSFINKLAEYKIK